LREKLKICINQNKHHLTTHKDISRDILTVLLFFAKYDTVIDPAIFIDKCLFDGIGPAKGFGCGLMLVRRM
jgi:hypothetical protein